MINHKTINEEVLYTTDDIVKVTPEDIASLKEIAARNKRKRVRLCCHSDMESSLHEMLIVHTRGAYIPPHKHIGKSESFHIIEGRLHVVIFCDDGTIAEVITMGAFHSGERFYYRIPENTFHSVIPISETVVFHEITNGPFIRENTIFPAWAPDEEEPEKVKIYLSKLEDEVAGFAAQPS